MKKKLKYFLKELKTVKNVFDFQQKVQAGNQ